MRVMCGFAGQGLRNETVESLSEFAPMAEIIDNSADDGAYWRSIEERWTGDEDLVIIEQDMVIDASTLPSFESCDQPWCSFGYTAVPHLGRITACLGCVRFTAKIQRIVPVEKIRLDYEEMQWVCLDVRIARALFLAGYEPHDHGDVTHLHSDYPFWIDLGKPRDSEYTVNEFCHFVPPILVNAGNRALYGYDDLVNGILARRKEESENG